MTEFKYQMLAALTACILLFPISSGWAQSSHKFVDQDPADSASERDDEAADLPAKRSDGRPAAGSGRQIQFPSPIIGACVRTIQLGDLASVNDDKAYPASERRECLVWLKEKAGPRLQEENKTRPVPLSLDDEIKSGHVGAAAGPRSGDCRAAVRGGKVLERAGSRR